MRAYYHCRHCGKGHSPADLPMGLANDHLSPTLRPLVTLAGTIAAFEKASDDILFRFAGIRLSAGTVWAVAEQAGADLLAFTNAGGVVAPSPHDKPWDFTLPEGKGSVGYIGLDAFSVPMQNPDATKADWRMMYLGVLYTPDKEHSEYVAGWDFDTVASELRCRAMGRGFARADRLVAVMDGGNGLEEAIHRHFNDGVLCILDWYHAVEHICDYAKAAWPGDESERSEWSVRAKGVLHERGGSGLLRWLGRQELPAAGDGLRLLVGYFEKNEHRTDYPTYREAGLDIGSGPTEAGCKVIGARLKGSGMRWCEDGVERIAVLRALYASGPSVWDGFWEATQQRRAA